MEERQGDRGEVEAAEAPAEAVHAEQPHRRGLDQGVRVGVEAFEAAFELEEVGQDEGAVVSRHDLLRELEVAVLVPDQRVPPGVDAPRVEADEGQHEKGDRPGFSVAHEEVRHRQQGETQRRQLEAVEGVVAGERQDHRGVGREDRQERAARAAPDARERGGGHLAQDHPGRERAEGQEELDARLVSGDGDAEEHQGRRPGAEGRHRRRPRALPAAGGRTARPQGERAVAPPRQDRFPKPGRLRGRAAEGTPRRSPPRSPAG